MRGGKRERRERREGGGKERRGEKKKRENILHCDDDLVGSNVHQLQGVVPRVREHLRSCLSMLPNEESRRGREKQRERQRKEERKRGGEYGHRRFWHRVDWCMARS